MGRRSGFPRRKHDDYDTLDNKAIIRLVPILRHEGIRSFAEPCAGNGFLVRHLEAEGFVCSYAGDIRTGEDALAEESFGDADAIVSNPPWTRNLLHPLIEHFMACGKIAWLLFDANWAWTQQSAGLLDRCSDILPTHRLRWIPGTRDSAKDDSCWYRFDPRHRDGPRVIGWAGETGVDR
jgi:hypothetical protein